MKTLKLKRDAFTMIEFIFVIIVIGILTSVGMSRLEKNNYQDAADSILSDIRYTQHLALLDNKYNADDFLWQRAFWTIGFEKCTSTVGSNNYFEYIGSDTGYEGGIENIEAAKDPLNGKVMNWSNAECEDGGDEKTSSRIFLTHNYGIKDIAFTGSCSGSKYIGFDNLGRVYQGIRGIPYSASIGYLKSTCTITFTLSDDKSFSIDIEPETGYAHIVDQNLS